MIHAWKGSQFYPEGPISDYVGVFDTEDEAKEAIGPVDMGDWAALMRADESGALVPLCTWREWMGFPKGWRKFNSVYE